MKMRLLKFVALMPLLFLAVASQVTPAHAYTNSHLIDDSVFDNVNSMSANSIQNFFNTRYPNGCLTNYQAPDPQSWSGYGANVSAAQAIYDSAHIWGINPQVIITTLEKEEGLVSGQGAYGCSQTAFNSAMGYDCPGGIQAATGTCVAHASNLGFSAQINHAAWQLEFGSQRSEGDGNLGYDGDGDIIYYGYMTQGTRARCDIPSSCPAQYYSGNITLDDGTNLNVDNGATASLYSYTPFLQSFSPIFEQFFGVNSTQGQPYAWSIVSQSYSLGSTTISTGQTETLTLVAQNTGSATWYNSGPNPVKLGTSSPNDRASAFYDPSWAAGGRPAVMTESSVAPGQDATFTFTIDAPNAPGTYLEHFNLLSENNTWFVDPGMYFTINVVPAYSWSIVSQSYSLGTTHMSPGQTETLTVVAKNTGSATWSNTTFPVKLATSDPTYRTSAFQTGSWPDYSRAAVLTESSVPPGSNGTFTFTVTAPGPGHYQEHFSLVAEGAAWFNDPGMYFDITVDGGYSWSIVSQSYSTGSVNIPHSSTATLTLVAKNTGNTTWYNSGNYPMRLATYNPEYRISPFQGSDWISPVRVATMSQASVAPGANATFTFTVNTPAQTGLYREYYSLVAEGAGWLNDTGMYYTINVQ